MKVNNKKRKKFNMLIIGIIIPCNNGLIFNDYWGLRICRHEINFLLLAPKESSLDCAQPSTHRVIPRLRSNRPGIFELILSCYRRHFFSLLPCHSVSFFLSYRNIFSLPVIPACFFICHSGLRAGVQINIDSLAIWIPGQARNDSKKTSPEWQ